MSLRFRYRLHAARQPILPLGGRWVRPRPVIGLKVIGVSGGRALDGRLDTGSDDTVFHEAVAAQIGVDLTSAPAGIATGVGMVPMPVRYAEVTLRIAGFREQREWRAWVGFTSARLSLPLLGFAGFLQFFDATFFGDREEVELVVNSLYPGT